jgi:hypothetical protein
MGKGRGPAVHRTLPGLRHAIFHPGQLLLDIHETISKWAAKADPLVVEHFAKMPIRCME